LADSLLANCHLADYHLADCHLAVCHLADSNLADCHFADCPLHAVILGMSMGILSSGIFQLVRLLVGMLPFGI